MVWNTTSEGFFCHLYFFKCKLDYFIANLKINDYIDCKTVPPLLPCKMLCD